MTHASHSIAQPGRSSRIAIALGRIGNLIVDPVAAFAHVDRLPTSALAFFTLIALRFTSALVFYQPDVAPARLAAGALFQIVTIWPLTIALTFLLWITSRALGARTSWAGTYCVIVHVMLAYTLVTIAIASVAGAFLPESTNVELRHPPFTNLGPLVNASAHPVAHALVAELDYRAAYALTLTYIGVRESSVERSSSRARLIVAACFAANLLVVVLVAYMRRP